MRFVTQLKFSIVHCMLLFNGTFPAPFACMSIFQLVTVTTDRERLCNFYSSLGSTLVPYYRTSWGLTEEISGSLILCSYKVDDVWAIGHVVNQLKGHGFPTNKVRY